jgi:hypothetical protein
MAERVCRNKPSMAQVDDISPQNDEDVTRTFDGKR